MTSAFIMTLLNPIFQKFRDYVLSHLNYTINIGHNVRALEGEAEKLKRKRRDVEDQIEIDEPAGKKARQEVEGWLETAEELEEEAASVGSSYRNRNFSINCISNHSIGMRATKTKAKVEAALRRIENIKPFTTDPTPHPVQEVPTATLGEESGSEIRSKLDRALDFLRNSPEGTLGIWGMGGVGKTTLLKHINNVLGENPSSTGFDRVVFVTVSRGCTVEMIQKQMAKVLRLPEKGDHYTSIFNYLNRKSFVLLLDDLWERLDLETVGIPTLGVVLVGEVKKHKVILTTRSHQVCLDMDARLTMRVECLSREKARQLFRERVGAETIESHPLIPALAEAVADECDGLPKALIAIARAMAGKRLVNLWEKAIKDLRTSKLSKVSGTEDPLPLLKLSYDYLKDPAMQECLLLCALWPEDWEIPADEVIECWMGHNLLGEFADLEEAYNNGYEIIDSLQKASLLEYSEGEGDILGEGRVSLHDLIRDMALWIARDCGANDKKWVVLANLRLKEAPQDERSWEVADKMSLVYNKIVTWPSHIQSAPNLTTLMLQSSLDFTDNFKIHDLAMTLRNCHALKYLDMSGNRWMGEFPIAICQLDKLEYLNLSFCDIRSLPEEVQNLKSLKYLLLQNNKISEVSSQVLSNLVSLEVLDLCYRTNYWRTFVQSLTIENNLECLECWKGRLKSFGTSVKVSSHSDLDKLARFSVVPIRSLRIDNMTQEENLTSVHLLPRLNSSCDGTWSNLNDLYINGYSGIEELVIDESSLPNRLHLKYFYGKEIVWKGVEQRDVFPKLRDIKLWGCNQLKHVSWIVNLPLLERLIVCECSSIEHVVCEEANETEGEGEHKTATLPCLKILGLFYLQKLESICNRAITLPFLQYLGVDNCPRLKKLPFDSHATCSKLRTIGAQEEWWKATLELDDDMRTHLQPFIQILPT